MQQSQQTTWKELVHLFDSCGLGLKVLGCNSCQPKHQLSQSPKLKVCNLHSMLNQGVHQGSLVHYNIKCSNTKYCTDLRYVMISNKCLPKGCAFLIWKTNSKCSLNQLTLKYSFTKVLWQNWYLKMV